MLVQALLTLALNTLLSQAQTVNVSISSTPDATAAVKLSPSLVSFSIEQDLWAEWAGTTTKNAFFYNALDNLKQLTGEPPFIRIGADSEDHTNFDQGTQISSTIFPAYTNTTPYPEATNITVGNGFYDLAAHLPAGTHVWWGVNFRDSNITAAYLEAMAILKAFNSAPFKAAGITLDFLEIGNEADLYAEHGLRPVGYGPDQYVPEWTAFATNITVATALYDTQTHLVGGAFAFSTHTIDGLSPQGIITSGILDSGAGSLITLISQHHYSGSFCTGSGGLLQELMTKATIRSNLTSFSPDIQATQQKGLEYVLGETNSYSCHGAPGVSNTAGAALWALDYILYAAQIGISRVHFHDGIGYKYNLIQPVTLTRSILDGSPLATPLAPHIQPAYYAAIITAEAMGRSGSTQAVEISIDDDSIAGYAFYEAGLLVRAILINSQAFLQGETTRGSVHINLAIDSNPQMMTIKRLSIGYADDTSGVTWGGQTYETPDARVSGKPTVQAVAVSVGVDIQDTEVVLLTFLV